MEAFDFQGYRVLQRSWSCATAGIHVATGSSSRVPHCRERVRSSSKSVRDSEHREPLLARSPPHSRRSMPAPVRCHVNAPGSCRRRRRSVSPSRCLGRAFPALSRSLEAHARRAQAQRIAARHPCAGDAMGLKIGEGGRSEAVHRELLLSARPRRGKAHDVCDEQVMMSVSGPDKLK